VPIHGINTKQVIKKLWLSTFHVMFHYYQLHYKMHNINTLQHVIKKSCLFKFHYPLPPMSITKILLPLELQEDILFRIKCL